MSERNQRAIEPGFVGRALVERLASGRLPPFLARRVHARLAHDPVLARHYDGLRRVERAAAGDPPLSAAQRDLMRSLLFDGASTETTARAPAASSRPWSRGLVALAGVAAVLLVILRMDVLQPVPLDDEWTARGGAGASVGVRARCLSAKGDAVLAQAEAGVGPRVDAPELSCPSGGLLALSATNRGAQDSYVFVVAIGPGGAPRWIAPFDEGARSRRVPAGAVDEVLGDLAALDPRGGDARLALHALFSPAPLTARQVSAALALARRQGLDVEKLARVPVDATAQARIDLVVRGGEEAR